MDTFDAWAMMADNYSQWENSGVTAWLRLAILLYGDVNRDAKRTRAKLRPR
jgi:hypothetical protein